MSRSTSRDGKRRTLVPLFVALLIAASALAVPALAQSDGRTEVRDRVYYWDVDESGTESAGDIRLSGRGAGSWDEFGAGAGLRFASSVPSVGIIDLDPFGTFTGADEVYFDVDADGRHSAGDLQLRPLFGFVVSDDEARGVAFDEGVVGAPRAVAHNDLDADAWPGGGDVLLLSKDTSLVRGGDVRLTTSAYGPAGSIVLRGDDDVGLPLLEMPGGLGYAASERIVSKDYEFVDEENPFLWSGLTLGLIAMALSWSMAARALVRTRRTVQNRRLARMLVLLGLSVAAIPAAIAADHIDALSVAGILIFFLSTTLLHGQWLGLAATLDTPLVRPLRRFAARLAFLVLLAASPFVLFMALGEDSVGAAGLGLIVAVPAFSFLAAISAYRKAERGSLEGVRARAFAVAFAALAGAYIGILLSFLWFQGANESIAQTIAIFLWPASAIVFVGLVAYGQLRPQIFDFDLKLKVGIKRSTIVGMILTAALAVFAILEDEIGTQFGILAAVLAPAVLFPMKNRLEKWAEKVSDVAMPKVEQSPEYLAMRKLTVYRNAVENALHDGLTPSEEQFLTDLREELGIAPDIANRVIESGAGHTFIPLAEEVAARTVVAAPLAAAPAAPAETGLWWEEVPPSTSRRPQ